MKWLAMGEFHFHSLALLGASWLESDAGLKFHPSGAPTQMKFG
jgi:hypothetical protein